VADALGMDWVMIHPLAGVLSAYGMGLAERSVVRERTLAIELIPANVSALRDMIAALESEARAVLVAQDIGDVPVRSEVQMLLRYVGTDSTIEVAAGEPEAMRTAFEVAYRQRFGFLSDAAVVVEMVRVEVIAEGGAPLHQPLAGPPPRSGEEFRARRFIPIPRRDLRARCQQRVDGCQSRARKAQDGIMFSGKGARRDHRSFRVARPASASTKLMIQNRITTVGSLQPSCSK
jgi:5-oxoprolinase (ATP-hydrolysing)